MHTLYPTILLLGIYPKETTGKAYKAINMFIMTLFVIVKKWKVSFLNSP